MLASIGKSEGWDLIPGRIAGVRMGLALVVALVAANGGARAQTPIGDLYIEAAAMAEKCGASALDRSAIKKLAAIISTETKVPITAADVSRRLDKARRTVSGTIDCAGPLTSIHVQFFNNVLLPRMEGRTTPPAPERSSVPD
jgi:hypothetical protein